MTRIIFLLLITFLSFPAYARGHGGNYSTACPRDANGKIQRSQEAKDEFKKAHPCPANGSTSGACPGYVIDHDKPLKRGGEDAPQNMQWQTIEDARAKDKWE
jgi:hypothetical protein